MFLLLTVLEEGHITPVLIFCGPRMYFTGRALVWPTLDPGFTPPRTTKIKVKFERHHLRRSLVSTFQSYLGVWLRQMVLKLEVGKLVLACNPSLY